MKKTSSKRQASKPRAKAAKKTVRKVARKVAAKAGVTKATVKKKVVTKLKRVGVAMARAALDELLPASQESAPIKPAARTKRAPTGAPAKSR